MKHGHCLHLRCRTAWYRLSSKLVAVHALRVFTCDSSHEDTVWRCTPLAENSLPSAVRSVLRASQRRDALASGALQLDEGDSSDIIKDDAELIDYLQGVVALYLALCVDGGLTVSAPAGCRRGGVRRGGRRGAAARAATSQPEAVGTVAFGVCYEPPLGYPPTASPLTRAVLVW